MPFASYKITSIFIIKPISTAESVSPALNREILERRVAELRASGAPVVTFCPICMANLLKAGPVEDLASLVGRYG